MLGELSDSVNRVIKSNGIVDNELSLQAAKELVVQDNPHYNEILSNLDNNLDSNLRYKDLMSYTNGNLITNDSSHEMKTLIAKAYNVIYGDNLTDRDIIFTSSNAKVGFQEVKVEKSRDFEKHEYGFLKYHHEKSNYHSSRTINAKSIIDAIGVIREHYNILNQLDGIAKAKMGAQLEGVTALQYATKHKKIKAIEELVKEGADPKGVKISPDIVDQVLKEAIENGNIQVIDNIIGCHTDFKENGSYLSYAIEQNKLEVAAHMIDKGFKSQASFLESLGALTDKYGGFDLEPEEIAKKIGGKVLEEYNKQQAFKQAKQVVQEQVLHTDLTKDAKNIPKKVSKKSSEIAI